MKALQQKALQHTQWRPHIKIIIYCFYIKIIIIDLKKFSLSRIDGANACLGVQAQIIKQLATEAQIIKQIATEYSYNCG